MITGDAFAWVVREISLLAEQHPVRIGGLNRWQGRVGRKIQESDLHTRIDFSGTYDEIGEFVRDLENKFPTAEIQSLAIAGVADDKGRARGHIGCRVADETAGTIEERGGEEEIMKAHAPPAIWTHRAWPKDGVRIHRNRPVTSGRLADGVEHEFIARQRTGSGSLATPLRVVGILAFCQAIFFLALFLLLCARAGSGYQSKAASRLALTLIHVYNRNRAGSVWHGSLENLGRNGQQCRHPHAGAEDFKLMGICIARQVRQRWSMASSWN